MRAIASRPSCTAHRSLSSTYIVFRLASMRHDEGGCNHGWWLACRRNCNIRHVTRCREFDDARPLVCLGCLPCTLCGPLLSSSYRTRRDPSGVHLPVTASSSSTAHWGEVLLPALSLALSLRAQAAAFGIEGFEVGPWSGLKTTWSLAYEPDLEYEAFEPKKKKKKKRAKFFKPIECGKPVSTKYSSRT